MTLGKIKACDIYYLFIIINIIIIRPRSKSVCKPVTGPRTFRQCLIKLNIDLDNKIVLNDHVVITFSFN
jgi:hypothetical protein